VFSCPGHANIAPLSSLGKCFSYSDCQLLDTTEVGKTHARRVAKAQESSGKDGHEIFAVGDSGELDISVNEVRKLSISDLETLNWYLLLVSVMIVAYSWHAVGNHPQLSG
jgi:hypothetical protein